MSKFVSHLAIKFQIIGIKFADKFSSLIEIELPVQMPDFDFFRLRIKWRRVFDLIGVLLDKISAEGLYERED